MTDGMLYALLRTAHLLAVTVWLGGMFFLLYCLRPAALDLPPPQRVALMQAVLGRFLRVVLAAAGVLLLSGLWMMGRVARAGWQAGLPFNMPLDWYVMAGLGLVMMAVFAHVRWALFPRVGRAAAAQDWTAGAATLASIRHWVMFNLDVGVLIVVVTRFGAGV